MVEEAGVAREAPVQLGEVVVFAVELAVALINVAVEAKPTVRGEAFAALMRIAAVANAEPDV